MKATLSSIKYAFLYLHFRERLPDKLGIIVPWRHQLCISSFILGEARRMRVIFPPSFLHFPQQWCLLFHIKCPVKTSHQMFKKSPKPASLHSCIINRSKNSNKSYFSQLTKVIISEWVYYQLFFRLDLLVTSPCRLTHGESPVFVDPKKSPLFGNGYHYPPHLANMSMPFMPLGHPMMSMAMANHMGMRPDLMRTDRPTAEMDLSTPR